MAVAHPHHRSRDGVVEVEQDEAGSLLQCSIALEDVGPCEVSLDIRLSVFLIYDLPRLTSRLQSYPFFLHVSSSCGSLSRKEWLKD